MLGKNFLQGSLKYKYELYQKLFEVGRDKVSPKSPL